MKKKCFNIFSQLTERETKKNSSKFLNNRKFLTYNTRSQHTCSVEQDDFQFLKYTDIHTHFLSSPTLKKTHTKCNRKITDSQESGDKNMNILSTPTLKWSFPKICSGFPFLVKTHTNALARKRKSKTKSFIATEYCR